MSGIKRVFGLSAAFAAAMNGTMVMPLIVLALNRIPGIDTGTATAIAACELAGIVVYSLACPRLVHRARRLVLGLGLVGLIAGEASTNYLDALRALAAARLVTGLGEGALFSLISANVAAERDAQRIWGQINLIGGLAMGLLLYALSALPVTSERGPIFLWLAAMGVVMAPWIVLAHATPRPAAQTADLAGLTGSRLALILVVVVLVYGIQAAQWAVSGYMGERGHMAPEQIALYLALSSVVGFAGAIVPSLSRDPRHRLAAVLAGFVVMAGALALFFNVLGSAPFLWGQIAVNVGFYMVTPFITGLLCENDRDGSLVLRTLVVALGGATLGTALAGEVFTRSGAPGFSVLCIIPIAISGLAAAAVFRGLPTTSTVPASMPRPAP